MGQKKNKNRRHKRNNPGTSSVGLKVIGERHFRKPDGKIVAPQSMQVVFEGTDGKRRVAKALIIAGSSEKIFADRNQRIEEWGLPNFEGIPVNPNMGEGIIRNGVFVRAAGIPAGRGGR